MIGKITFSREPEGWSQEKFLALGGFTVVFLNYNKSAYIKQSVVSALNQDFPLCEMFFMDDASSDGSGDEMERLVRAYGGPHKVTVVRNARNQNITGQWNIVAKLATGNWFGMFCADDIADPSRVSQAAEILCQTPSLRGFCTSGVEINTLDGSANRPIGEGYANNEATGRTSLFDITHGGTAVVGATAFWHKSLFSAPLPPAPLDDVLIRLVLQLRYRDCADVIWRWDTNRCTVRYAIGGGVSTSYREIVDRTDSSIDVWRKRFMESRRFALVMAKSWTGIYAYYKANGAAVSDLAFVKCEKILQRILAAGTWGRVALLPDVVCSLLGRSEWHERKLLLRSYLKRLTLEFFGIGFAAFVSARLLNKQAQ